MSETAILLPPGSTPQPVDPRLLELQRMVLAAVISPHSKRNYAKALEDLFLFAAGRPLTRALLMDWRAGMEQLAASTINVRLSAMRKLVTEARRNGMLGAEEAASLTDVPSLRRGPAAKPTAVLTLLARSIKERAVFWGSSAHL